MKSVYMIICDSGDCSQHLEWHKTMSETKSNFLEESYEMYKSGDGIQVTEIKFSDNFDLDLFAFYNNISWYEDNE